MGGKKIRTICPHFLDKRIPDGNYSARDPLIHKDTSCGLREYLAERRSQTLEASGRAWIHPSLSPPQISFLSVLIKTWRDKIKLYGLLQYSFYQTAKRRSSFSATGSISKLCSGLKPKCKASRELTDVTCWESLVVTTLSVFGKEQEDGEALSVKCWHPVDQSDYNGGWQGMLLFKVENFAIYNGRIATEK